MEKIFNEEEILAKNKWTKIWAVILVILNSGAILTPVIINVNFMTDAYWIYTILLLLVEMFFITTWVIDAPARFVLNETSQYLTKIKVWYSNHFGIKRLNIIGNVAVGWVLVYCAWVILTDNINHYTNISTICSFGILIFWAICILIQDRKIHHFLLNSRGVCIHLSNPEEDIIFLMIDLLHSPLTQIKTPNESEGILNITNLELESIIKQFTHEWVEFDGFLGNFLVPTIHLSGHFADENQNEIICTEVICTENNAPPEINV